MSVGVSLPLLMFAPCLRYRATTAGTKSTSATSATRAAMYQSWAGKNEGIGQTRSRNAALNISDGAITKLERSRCATTRPRKGVCAASVSHDRARVRPSPSITSMSP